MNDDLIAQIQTFTLNARAILESEASQQLEGIYGWLPEGPFVDAKAYPAIAQFEEARETRRRLEQLAEDEKAAGLSSVDVREKLVRETAFTWLNRFAAFRLMEERKLLKPTILKLEKSNGYIYWLTDDANKDAYALHQQGSLPINAMDEGPIDVAYRRFLLWQCGELARDVSVLFDPDILASRLCPRPNLLKQLVTEMNVATMADAWQPRNDEILGWIYEGFIADENKAVFDKFSDGKKVQAEEIGAATQRFTPRWIVRFLVENSLGRLWTEMHPDSRLAKTLAYLVPADRSQSRPIKHAKHISFLDPCCGSMHFGLVAFDVFAEMYREELDRQGQSGWPAEASVSSIDEIAGSIIAHNLYGIDLDLRAIQIAALVLFLKARTGQPKAAFSDLNLGCANVEQVSAGRLDGLITQAKFSHPVHERILRTLVGKMKQSEHLGSLLRLENVLESLIDDERKQAESQKQLSLSLPGASSEQFKTQEGIEEFFGKLSTRILEELDRFVRASRSVGSDPGYIVNEAQKGLRYLRIVSRHHDVVATNPPYMSRRNMSGVMLKHLDGEYAKSKGDLYAAFISRCVNLAGPLGKIAMVTQQSFMFISTYEDFRGELRSSVAVDTMIHLGPKAFPNITGEKVNTTAFVFEKQPDAKLRDEHIGTYFRLVKEPNADSKRQAFEATLVTVGAGETHRLYFCYVQADFDAIPGKPWVYWFGPSIRNFFGRWSVMATVSPSTGGMTTSDNGRFVRFWWEVGLSKIARKLTSRVAATASGKRWFSYLKGGAGVKWVGRGEHVVNWENDGAEMKEAPSFPRSQQYYFRPGICWSDVDSTGFAARIVSAGSIFDATNLFSAAPTDRTHEILGILNSRLALYLLSGLNPTIHYQVGDIERLPIPSERSARLDDGVAQCVELAIQNSRESELTSDFIVPLRRLDERVDREAQLAARETEIDSEVSRLFGLSEADLAAIDRELGGTPACDAIEDEGSERTFDSEVKADSTPGEWARSWVSYAIGTVLGRYGIGEAEGLGRGDFDTVTVTALRELIDPDGVMVSEKDHPQDIVRRTVQCLELMCGHDATEKLIRDAVCKDGGDPEELLRRWFDRFTGNSVVAFWKYHHQLYRKRPVFWPLQSPKKTFTVWSFQERLTKDTLFTVKNLVDGQLRLVERATSDLRSQAHTSSAKAKDLDKLLYQVDDLKEFSNRINNILQRGYTPHIDDGVLLNAAPLWEVLPSWPETKKAWNELESEEYDWAEQAMHYWPGRVNEKCKTDRSLAIAHRKT